MLSIICRCVSLISFLFFNFSNATLIYSSNTAYTHNNSSSLHRTDAACVITRMRETQQTIQEIKRITLPSKSKKLCNCPGCYYKRRDQAEELQQKVQQESQRKVKQECEQTRIEKLAQEQLIYKEIHKKLANELITDYTEFLYPEENDNRHLHYKQRMNVIQEMVAGKINRENRAHALGKQTKEN